MPKDWRDASAYDHFDDLDISGLAWECLRRNESYRSQYRAMMRGTGSPAGWGLRFRGRSGA